MFRGNFVLGTTYILDVGFHTFGMTTEGGRSASQLEEVAQQLTVKPSVMGFGMSCPTLTECSSLL